MPNSSTSTARRLPITLVVTMVATLVVAGGVRAFSESGSTTTTNRTASQGGAGGTSKETSGGGDQNGNAGGGDKAGNAGGGDKAGNAGGGDITGNTGVGNTTGTPSAPLLSAEVQCRALLLDVKNGLTSVTIQGVSGGAKFTITKSSNCEFCVATPQPPTPPVGPTETFKLDQDLQSLTMQRSIYGVSVTFKSTPIAPRNSKARDVTINVTKPEPCPLASNVNGQSGMTLPPAESLQPSNSNSQGN